MSNFNNASLIVTPNPKKAGKLYSIKPTNGTGDLDVVRATTATFVGSNGLIQTAGNNVPRLDYSNGTCPSILVEPQGTNLALQSEMFSQSEWGKLQSTITPNTISAPNGTLTADTFNADGSSNFHSLNQVNTVTIGNSYTISIYVKKNNNDFIQIAGGDATFGSNFWANFDINNGIVGSVGSSTNASIKALTNGWFRCSISGTAISTVSSVSQIYSIVTSLTSVRLESNSLNTSVYIWGAQFEFGSNATSYIPTTASAVTRNADVINKTGISSLIGQTEGTILVKGAQFNRGEVFRIRNNTNIGVNGLYIFCIETQGRVQVGVIKNGVLVRTSAVIPVNSVNTKNIIMVYSQNILKIFISGLLVYNYTYPTPTDFTTVLNTVEFGSLTESGTATFDLIALWKTVLTDAQAIQLTTL